MSYESRSQSVGRSATLEQESAVLAGLATIERIARETLRIATDNSERVNMLATVPDDARQAMIARFAGRTRGHFTVTEFAAVIGRHRQWVSDRCAARVIRTLRGGKPYRIPLEEEGRWNEVDEKGGR